MTDTSPDREPLNLAAEFPATPTSEWEAVIAADLKGADYEKKLVHGTEEGIALRPYYRKESLAGLEGQLSFRRGERGWEIAQGGEIDPGAVRADLLHEAGAHGVQELAWAMAAGVERLAGLAARQPVDQAARAITFVFAVGPAYFMEIAKLRAARLLWAQVLTAFGAKDPDGGTMRIHARTPWRNKSLYDRHTNLLRVTTEALSAVIGGCDRLTIDPFGFDPHLAVNIQRILQEETHLDAVADPAGGSYYVESLTDSMARAAWDLFRQVEAEGGYSKSLASGSIGKAVAAARAARAQALSSRRRSLVGVNNYPNLTEKEAPAGPSVTETASPLPAARVAEPFEAIRQRTIEHARATGRYPRVLLLTRGDVRMRGARSNFCLNFFGCAGFDIAVSDGFEGAEADLIVLCSSDPEYAELAREVCPKAKVPVLVAGYPREQIEALRAAGVAGFVHVGSDAVATLTEWQDKLGMRSGQ